MDGPRYYYSVDGSVVRGPVNADAIRRLCEQRILTASSLLCPEGASEWQQLQPETFAPSVAHVARPLAPSDRLLAKGVRSERTVVRGVTIGVGRLAYFFGRFVCGGIIIALFIFDHPDAHNQTAIVVHYGIIVAMAAAALVLVALRLENMGHSQWLCLLIFVPLAGSVLGFYCLFAPPDCAGTRASWITLLIALGLVVLLVLAFFALGVLSGVLAQLSAHGRLPH